jgi:segregation and condensation protein A
MKEKEENKKVGQEQIYDLLTSRELSWQAIIYELIRTEQLDPWDINIVLLSQKYIETINQIQEQEGLFFISSKVLLAAAILLRLKSEILHENIRDIDEILFAKKPKNEIARTPQIITLEEEEIPLIMPRTPLPRARKVTLPELMQALEKAINTEHRRIKRTLISEKVRRDLNFAVFPKQTVSLSKKILDLLSRIRNFFSKTKKEKMMFSEILTSQDKSEKIATFVPLLHLDHQKKVWLEQEKPFSDIEIWLKRDMAERARALRESIKTVQQDLKEEQDKKENIIEKNK